MSQIVAREYTLTITSTPGDDRKTLDIRGNFIRCTSASDDFTISVDDSPEIPFGLARALSQREPDGTAYVFRKVTVIRSATSTSNTNTIKLVVGEVNLEDTRTGLFSNQTVRETCARSMSGKTVTLTAAVVFGDSLTPTGVTEPSVTAPAVSFLTNVRNLSAVNAVRIGTTSDSVTLAADGYYLGPGENVDLPISAYYLYAKGTAGQQVVVTSFLY